MQVIELMRLADWFSDRIIGDGILDEYNNLKELVSNNMRSSTRIPFEEERDLLVESVQKISLSDLSLEQIELLENMGLTKLLGYSGAQHITSVMEKNNADIASISNHISNDCATLTSAHEYFSFVRSQLGKYFEASTDGEIADDEVLIRVYFRDEASISNITEFKNSGSDWYQIGRGIAYAMDMTPEDIRVSGAEKGSVIINMVAAIGIANFLCNVISKVLDITQRIMEIRKGKLEIENLKLQNKRIALDLDKEIAKEEESGVDNVLKELCKEYKIKNSEAEKKAMLKKSIELLFKFMQNGGKIDFVHNEDDDEESEEQSKDELLFRDSMKKLDDNLIKIHELENNLKLLNNKEEDEN